MEPQVAKRVIDQDGQGVGQALAPRGAAEGETGLDALIYGASRTVSLRSAR